MLFGQSENGPCSIRSGVCMRAHAHVCATFSTHTVLGASPPHVPLDSMPRLALQLHPTTPTLKHVHEGDAHARSHPITPPQVTRLPTSRHARSRLFLCSCWTCWCGASSTTGWSGEHAPGGNGEGCLKFSSCRGGVGRGCREWMPDGLVSMQQWPHSGRGQSRGQGVQHWRGRGAGRAWWPCLHLS